MKSILIKESDRLFSKLPKNNYVSVYLIYLIQDDVKLECYSELGKENKDMRVNELIVANFDLAIAVEDIIQEVTFDEFKNN
jgi:hypothetical protein